MKLSWEKNISGELATLNSSNKTTITPSKLITIIKKIMSDLVTLSVSIDDVCIAFEPVFYVLIETQESIDFVGVYNQVFEEGGARLASIRTSTWNKKYKLMMVKEFRNSSDIKKLLTEEYGYKSEIKTIGFSDNLEDKIKSTYESAFISHGSIKEAKFAEGCMELYIVNKGNSINFQQNMESYPNKQLLLNVFRLKEYVETLSEEPLNIHSLRVSYKHSVLEWI